MSKVSREQQRQRKLFGDQNDKDDLEWLAVTSEEWGEAARELNEMYFNNTPGAEKRMEKELIETMACIKTWLENRGDS